MKRFIKALSLPALALLIYMMVQFVVGSVIAIITKMADTVVSVEMMSVILLVSSVITSVVLLTVKCLDSEIIFHQWDVPHRCWLCL